MGKSYSVNGYINAILRRSEKTLLVEGVTDVCVLGRLLAETPFEKGVTPKIDTATIFNDALTVDMGNRERIIFFKEAMKPFAEQFPKLEAVFATLMDREWDGLSLDGAKLQGEWCPPQQTNNSFTTLGHSIENYCFDFGSIFEYLKHSFSKDITADFVRLLESRFLAILGFGASYSLLAKDLSCIKRCIGLLKLEYIDFDGNNFYLNDSFANALASRNFPEFNNFLINCNAATREFWNYHSADVPANWLLHGHLGLEAIWACVGYLAKQEAFSEETVEQIVSGRKAEKDRFMHSWITNHLPPERRTPLDDAVAWMLAPPVVS